MVGHLVGMMVLSYIMTFLCTFNGLKSTGKFVWVSCLSPYVILGILLVKGATLSGSGSGLGYLFIPTEKKMALVGQGETWRKAAVQILFSSGVAYGPFLYYGTARGKADKLVGPSLWIPLANSATSLYAGITMFLFLGHVRETLNVPMDQVASSGPVLLFVAFPSMLNFFPGAQFFAVVFFAMAVFLGIDSVFGWVDYYIKMFRDMFPILDVKFKHWLQVAMLMTISFIWSLMFVMEGGIYNFNGFDDYCSSTQLLVCLFAQCLFVPYFFGIHKLSELIFIRTGQRIPKFFILVIRTFVPLFGFIMLHFSYTGEFSTDKYIAKTTGSAKWTAGHLWGFRLLIIIPLIMWVVAMFFPLKECKSLDEYVEEQYGIRFKPEPEGFPMWKYLFLNQAEFEETNSDLYQFILANPNEDEAWKTYQNGPAEGASPNQVAPAEGAKTMDGETNANQIN